MDETRRKGIWLAVLAAALYAISAPIAKLLLGVSPPTLTAGFLYLGAGLGMGLVAVLKKGKRTETREEKLSLKELPFVAGMILLDIAAPVCLLFGLQKTTAANASLLNNFEIVATALFALFLFREKVSGRLWTGIALVTVSCAVLSFDSIKAFRFSFGSLLILLACVCWGLENNCTRKISCKDPLQIVTIKGIFSGGAALIIGVCVGETIVAPWSVFAILSLGFVSYGLSIFFYVYAQRFIGAARTSAYYAVAPFIGALLSLIIFWEVPKISYLIALGVMIIGGYICAKEES